VTSWKRMQDSDGRPKGFGFCEFKVRGSDTQTVFPERFFWRTLTQLWRSKLPNGEINMQELRRSISSKVWHWCPWKHALIIAPDTQLL
jgi:hypothetical protein